jgi:hypothetical protein
MNEPLTVFVTMRYRVPGLVSRRDLGSESLNDYVRRALLEDPIASVTSDPGEVIAVTIEEPAGDQHE